jgi:hypothetical protein
MADEGNRFSFMALNANAFGGLGEVSTIYRDPTMLHMFLSFSLLSLFFDLLINPSRKRNPILSATGGGGGRGAGFAI